MLKSMSPEGADHGPSVPGHILCINLVECAFAAQKKHGDNPEVSAKSHGVCISGIGKPAAESEIDLRTHASTSGAAAGRP